MTRATLNIKKGDNVIVLSGKDKGAKGEVLKVLPRASRVIVQGVNTVTKHNKPGQLSQGGIEKKEASIHVSNIALADPKTGKATRIGYKTLDNGKKVRVALKSGETVE